MRFGFPLRLPRSAEAQAFFPAAATSAGIRPIRHLTLPPVGMVFLQQAGLQKDFAESVYGFSYALIDPRFCASQHGGDFTAREIVHSNQRNHFRMLIAQACQTQFDVAHEDRLFLETGNGMMRHLRPEELPAQERRQPSHLAGELEEVPHDGERLPSEAQHFRPGIEFKQLLLVLLLPLKRGGQRFVDDP